MTTVLGRLTQSKFQLLLLFGVLFAASARAQDVMSWQALARELRAESPATVEKARSDLQRIQGLEGVLRSSLSGPDQGAALEVIAQLRLKSLVPDLIKLGQGADAPWRVIATLGSLVDDQNKALILGFYDEKLASLPVQEGGALKVALLESMARLGGALQPARLEGFLKDPSYEVRIAAVEFAGRSAAAGDAKKRPEYLPVLKAALSISPYQARLAAFRGLERLPLEQRVKALPERERCERETHAEVKDLCRALVQAGRSK